VLSSVFALFLCGVVVTYVANAQNYKEQYETQRSRMQSAVNNERYAQEELDDAKAAHAQIQEDLQQQLSDLQIERDELDTALTDAKRNNDVLRAQVSNSQVTVTTTSNTQRELLQQADTARARVAELEASVTRLETELDQTNQLLLNKLGIIEMLEATNDQLVQANHDLESRANSYLQPSGRVATAPQPVTPMPGVAQPAEAMPTRQIDIDGRIVAVDTDNALASISIGETAGVSENMRFYVTRGDRFIANLTIQYVDSEKAVGTLSQVQSQPQAGDMIATNL
jgi:TolA-binding protein